MSRNREAEKNRHVKAVAAGKKAAATRARNEKARKRRGKVPKRTIRKSCPRCRRKLNRAKTVGIFLGKKTIRVEHSCPKHGLVAFKWVP